jgi:hypothetical protein
MLYLSSQKATCRSASAVTWAARNPGRPGSGHCASMTSPTERSITQDKITGIDLRFLAILGPRFLESTTLLPLGSIRRPPARSSLAHRSVTLSPPSTYRQTAYP